MLFLIESRGNENSDFEPLDVIDDVGGRAALERADTKYAKNTHSRRARPLTPAVMAYLEQRELYVCEGGKDCPHGNSGPHFIKVGTTN